MAQATAPPRPLPRPHGGATDSNPPVPHRRSQALSAHVFLAPWLIGMIALTLGPMLTSLYLSFTDYGLFTTPKWVGLANYRYMLEDDRFLASIGVTLKFVLIGAPLKLAAALAVALLLNRTRRGVGLYRAAFYAPSLLGASVSVALVWRSLFATDGFTDRTLGSLGIHLGGFTDNPDYALYPLITLTVWQFGAPMVIFLAGLKQIPRELYEAASLDGASRVRTFVSITLPMLSPVLFFNLVLEIINSFQSFTSAFVISNGSGGPSDSTLLYSLYLYEQAFTNFHMGYASAMAWVLLIVIALVTAIVFRTSRMWVYYGQEDAS
ncbi:sugar ABC transporter permease [Streptomyces sp. KM273126]|uniref:carbohydrate ABC transporter permease n=1 Tax=Streptomyces sp. KM273126 TaxID=2545247 RepID=UPI00103E6229|nr:sugar ABC transporter permease [Streptomyces sp. KM273126]MBA2813264.1 sugar ABC transporter permease [Streptomyces sp. KM273126]